MSKESKTALNKLHLTTQFTQIINNNSTQSEMLFSFAHTKHPWENHPLHYSGWGSLHVQVGAGDVLRGQQQEEEEGQVGGRVADKLDEGLLDEVSQSALGSQQVDLSEEGKNNASTQRRVGKERNYTKNRYKGITRL